MTKYQVQGERKNSSLCGNLRQRLQIKAQL